ncbi:MAG TPA: cystatin domain-containing protein [Pyrinomonadaceae bacterium]|jgi:hypothetical protein
MKNKSRNILILAVFCLLMSAVSVTAQIKTGGYKAISADDSGAKAAADFAVETKSGESEIAYELESIEKAETQTVAGTNYRLCLKLYVPSDEEETDGVTMFVQTVVFRNLKNAYSVTSWTELEEECVK